jgi:hypothetical protein
LEMGDFRRDHISEKICEPELLKEWCAPVVDGASTLILIFLQIAQIYEFIRIKLLPEQQAASA